MSNILKIVATFLMARSATSKLNIAKELLSILAVIGGLALMISILAGSFVMAGIYFGYTLLIDGGYSQTTALAITAGTLLAIIAGLVYAILQKLQKLNEFPQMFAQAEAPITHKVQSVAESFIDGLLKRGNEHSRYN